MDDLDHTEERESVAAPARLAAFRMPVGPEATGKCLNCDEPLALNRWCSSECLVDWHKRQRADAQRPT